MPPQQRAATTLNFIWIVELRSKLPARLASKEAFDQAVQKSIGNFDSEYPGRRIDEPIDIEYRANGELSVNAPATMRVRVRLKVAGKEDAFVVDRAFTQAFETQGLCGGE